jgi:chromosomal replication initiation ATPase DnaA
VIRQFTFDLSTDETYRSQDYFPSGSNATAYAQVMGRDWPGGRMLLIGPPGAGKSHLAHIWAETSGAQILAARGFGVTDLTQPDGAVVVEDAEALAGNPGAEEALFHLWNRANLHHPLLITASGPPRDWGIALPDLLSRMQSLALAQLDPPDDALLAAVLVKLFADCQVHVQPNLIAFLVSRMERSVAVARQTVAALDAQALAEGKPITRAMAATLMGAAGDLDMGPDE